MDSTLAQYWGQRIKSAYEGSQWTDRAGQIFAAEDISQIEQDLRRLGAACESMTAFVKKAEELLSE